MFDFGHENSENVVDHTADCPFHFLADSGELLEHAHDNRKVDAVATQDLVLGHGVQLGAFLGAVGVVVEDVVES